MIHLRDFHMSSVIDYIVSPQKASMDSGQHKQRPIVSLNRKKILSSRHEPHRHIPAKILPPRHGGLSVLLQRAGG